MTLIAAILGFNYGGRGNAEVNTDYADSQTDYTVGTGCPFVTKSSFSK
jgi:hypothetical protein